MIKRSKNYIFFGICIGFLALLLIKSEIMIGVVREAIDVWAKTLVPSLFPFFLLSEFLIYYDGVQMIGRLLRPVLTRICHFSDAGCFVFAMSMVSGFPSGAKYISDLVERGTMSREEGNHLLSCTHFSNPLFIMGTIATLSLQDKRVGILILFSHYTANLVIAFLKRKHTFSKVKTTKQQSKEKENFGTFLTKAVLKTWKNLATMLGIIILFFLITKGITTYLPMSTFQNALLSGVLEMTQGVLKVSHLMIPIFYKGLFITLLLSFGGLSVHLQVLSFIDPVGLNYRSFLKNRAFHVVLAGILFAVSFFFFY